MVTETPERDPPKNAFVAAYLYGMKHPHDIGGMKDAEFTQRLEAHNEIKLTEEMDSAPEAPEEEWMRREDCIKALCACTHAPHAVWKGRASMKDHVIGLRDLHKAWPTKRWNANQMCRLALLRTAYRDQLPAPFAPIAPLMDPLSGRLHGQSPLASVGEHYADEFITWTGAYKPFHFQRGEG